LYSRSSDIATVSPFSSSSEFLRLFNVSPSFTVSSLQLITFALWQQLDELGWTICSQTGCLGLKIVSRIMLN
jgi:hypothetical protein